MGFCVLGAIGNCGGSKQTVVSKNSSEFKEFASYMNKVVNNISTKIVATASNTMDIHAVTKGTIVVSGNTVSQKAEVHPTIHAKLADHLKSSDFIDKIMNFLSKQGLKTKQGAEGSIFKTTQLTKTENYVMEQIKTKITNEVHNTDTKSIVTDAQNQIHWDLGTKFTKGDIKITNNHINQLSKNISNIMLEGYVTALNEVKITDKIKNKLQQEDTVKQKKTDPIADIPKSLFSQLGKFSNLIIGGIIAVVIIIVIFMLLKFL